MRARRTALIRGTSPALLVLAALCFLLPFVGASCNTAATQGVLGSAVQQFGGTGAQSAQALSCLRALDNRDLLTYSGSTLAFGGAPSAPTTIAGCPSASGGSQPVGERASIGVQPAATIAVVLIAIGLVAAAVRAPLRSLAGGGAAMLAAILLVVANTTAHEAVSNRIIAEAGQNLSGLGITSVSAFFSVHPAIGFWLALLALVAAIAVNGVALAQPRAPAVTAAPTPPGRGPPGA